MRKISRRNALKLAAATAVSAVAAGNAVANQTARKRYKSGLPLPIGMNCGTLNGYNLKLEEQIKLISKAGYDGIEPWTRHIEDFISRGNKISEVKKRLEDADLKPDNLIGFAKCMLDDPAERKKYRANEARDRLGGGNRKQEHSVHNVRNREARSA